METLVKISMVIPLVGTAAYFLYFKDSGENDKGMTYITDSVDLLKGYQPAVDVLGLPIKAAKINEKDPFNQIDMKKVQVKVPIEGKKRLADLMVYATREDNDKNWKIDQLEIKYSGAKAKYKFYDNSLIKETTPRSVN